MRDCQQACVGSVLEVGAHFRNDLVVSRELSLPFKPIHGRLLQHLSVKAIQVHFNAAEHDALWHLVVAAGFDQAGQVYHHLSALVFEGVDALAREKGEQVHVDSNLNKGIVLASKQLGESALQLVCT